MSEESGDDTLHLHVSVGDVTIEVNGNVDNAETWFEALQEDYLGDIDPDILAKAIKGDGGPSENPEAEQSNHSGSSPSSKGKSKSLTEYYRMADNPTKQDSALIVGWYLEYHENESDFTKPEIEERAKDAKVSLGANVSRDLSSQVKNSHLEKVDERDGQDAYHLTLTGEEYVENELLGSKE